MRPSRRCAGLLWLWTGLVGCGSAVDPLVISAASSLGPLLAEFHPRFERSSGRRLEISVAGSSTLRVQIQRGAPVDVFLAASSAEVERLGRDRVRLVTPLARNQMVCAAPLRATAASLAEALAAPARVGVADIGVPAGEYATSILRSLGLWESTRDRLVRFPHEQATLQAVRRGAVDAGWVYASSARDHRVRVFPIDPARQPPMSVVGVVISEDPDGPRFLETLRGERELWTRFGFLPAEP